ncbi:YppF family protein [Bacillus tuaregi]|uniref:YppF family protein n=1 Tax=Bacillus tuaregi TaxID=1816695 RepID=UPI0008F97191|nr:YppF family protein [Bacillus tuaregi]
MTIHELKLKFLQLRDYLTDDVNVLLDFTKKEYVQNKISIIEYRNLVRELENLGAKFPDIFIDHSIIH